VSYKNAEYLDIGRCSFVLNRTVITVNNRAILVVGVCEYDGLAVRKRALWNL
jgi:hypothetical protein